ncbi:MAG: sucrose-6F-phosphate phosphohydrolase-domain-containing protein [Monoraphidium minutum]|nr:MAG: sucrose-6F-phosphate phosphohydrolase-domain-containing protein [Monoraphidium minutum]
MQRPLRLDLRQQALHGPRRASAPRRAAPRPSRRQAAGDGGAGTAEGVAAASLEGLTPVASLTSMDEAASAVTVFYASPWGQGCVHGSLEGGAWRDFPFSKVASAPGKWLRAKIPVSADAGANGGPVLEFVVTDGGGQWDKPVGGNYEISAAGAYTLRSGAIKAVKGRAVCLVSDLDGTMVGDDVATAAFKAWWEDTAVVRGGLLVYNTGRSLDSFKQLLDEKGHCLARPDVLISAVGTKIYNYAGAGNWAEDEGWVERLGEGWDLGVVREAAYKALAEVGREAMHFRPPEEQNDHKVTCGVQVGPLPGVLERIGAVLEKGRVDCNIITSGTGDWRFLDLVPKRAGKLQALDYVRQAHGFPLSATVACGDSGNDILMLSGPNLAVVVGNAQPDLVKWVEQHESDASPLPGKARLHRAAASEARGILEALEYWGLR